MKRVMMIATMAFASCVSVGWVDAMKPRPYEVKRIYEAKRWDNLAAAISWVESRDDDEARNPKSDAVGRWQMRRIYVDEVNRILRERGSIKRYRYADRKDKVKAREMFEIYQNKHNPEHDILLAIRLHRGLNSPSYRQAVLNKMEELR